MVLHYNINGYLLPVTVNDGEFYEMKFQINPEYQAKLDEVQAANAPYSQNLAGAGQ